jgi:hypothetical protein
MFILLVEESLLLDHSYPDTLDQMTTVVPAENKRSVNTREQKKYLDRQHWSMPLKFDVLDVSSSLLPSSKLSSSVESIVYTTLL